ncbi:saccharopine dehydrogenase-like oxidoreductase [Epargyreus clarus]|uniref:saccharopine dehydrogenase-like oxidoreductase n=1 Tax=Epargyreus clarus TaxID=520877 RepID=UPI003C30BC7C
MVSFNLKSNSDIRWGISGRSMDKLQNLLSEIRELEFDTSKILVLESDVTKEEAIKKVTRSAKVIINCTGPNTDLSETVVKACIATGTHYVDISAELYHILNIYRTYNKTAEDAEVLIIPACGFISMPAVTGLMYLEKHFMGTLHSVDCYMDLQIPRRAYFGGCKNSVVHYGTWQSFVYDWHNNKRYTDLKKEIFPEPVIEPEQPENKKSFFHKRNGRWWYKYPSPDLDIVEMSQRYLQSKKGKRPVYFKMYSTMPLLIHFFIVIPALFFYYYASRLKFFRNLLWKFPRFFTLGLISHKGPSEQMRNDLKFSFKMTGKGWDNADTSMDPNQSLTIQVSGTDPAYETTALSVLMSAITILSERHHMPRGGILSLGSAFCDTTIIDKLNSGGLKFEILKT